MGIEQHELNLARKLRPRQFSQVVGQEITVKILQNSLYLGKRFPLYIFSGQRGCGKTTSARIFAAALNCMHYKEFRRDPRTYTVPCLTCESCRAMEVGNHYDFIEMDAASHTGVENVRSILDSAQHKPFAGAVKIYLIDEAHMLSKAAFNAFLKILEEPPPFVVFILATTDMHKIPDTVISRAFNVFFQSINGDIVTSYLRNVCTQENIAIDDDALEVLVHEGGGSLRDSINVLETVRLSGNNITREHALEALGRISEEKILDLFDHIVAQDSGALLEYLAQIRFDQIRPGVLWDMLIALVRALIWASHDIAVDRGLFRRHNERIRQVARSCSRNRLQAMIQLIWEQEQVFVRTSHKHVFLEHVLLGLCEQVNIAPLADILQSAHGASTQHKPSPSSPSTVSSVPSKQADKSSPSVPSAPPPSTIPVLPNSSPVDATWSAFQKEVKALEDPLLTSIICQATFHGSDATRGVVTIGLAGGGAFFSEKLDESQTILASLISTHYPSCFRLEVVVQVAKTSGAKPGTHETTRAESPRPTSSPRPSSRRIDVSDKEQWPKAHLLGEHFSGNIEKVPDDA